MLDLDYKMIIYANYKFCMIQNETYGIKDENLLKSLIPSANQEVFGTILYPTIELKISYLVSSIAKNHIFINANKRTAIYLFSYLVDKYNLPDKSDNDLFKIIQLIVKNKFDVEYAYNLLFK